MGPRQFEGQPKALAGDKAPATGGAGALLWIPGEVGSEGMGC